MEAPLPNGTDGRTVVLTAGLAEVDRTMAQLRTVLLTAIPVMLLAAAGVAYLLATRALAPVTALVREARSITAQSLDRRLPIANPHDELGRLAATVNDMVGRLERSFAEMRRFTADASHELRTPLAVIRAEAEAALGRTAEEEVRQMLGSALEDCDRLSRLTDQLLTLARQDAGLLGQRGDPVNLAGLTSGVVETLRPLADVKGVTLCVEPGAPAAETVVRGDPDRLRQVLLNVLDNALKHTASGSVTARVKTAGPAVTVEVRDTGEGIPPEHLPHVFERFYRVDAARTREQGGTGLGLSIAKSIVEAHGGRIELNSLPGQGTTCVITLPRSVGQVTAPGDTQ
jgi:heavy metal sensor kinase